MIIKSDLLLQNYSTIFHVKIKSKFLIIICQLLGVETQLDQSDLICDQC